MDSELHADLASAHASYEISERDVAAYRSDFGGVQRHAFYRSDFDLCSHASATRSRARCIVFVPFWNRFRIAALNRIRAFARTTSLGELAISLDRAIKTVKTDIHELHQSVWRLRESHAKADTASFEAEITAIERTLDSWEKN